MKKRMQTILLITLVLLFAAPVVYAGSKIAASTVTYNGSKSGLQRKTVQGAVDTLWARLQAIQKGTADVTYDNAASGLSATTVSGALNELGIQAQKAISTKEKIDTADGQTGGGTLGATSWAGTIYDVCQNSLRTTAIEVTFTPADATTGTWTSTPYNAFNAGTVCTGANGEYAGSYRVAENMIFAHAVTKSGTATGTGYTALVEAHADTLRLLDTRTSPNLLTVLEKQ